MFGVFCTLIEVLSEIKKKLRTNDWRRINLLKNLKW